MLSHTNLIQETNFNNAWYSAIQHVINNKMQLKFGALREPKIAWDSCQLIELTGNAIKQIEKHEIHPQYPFKTIEQYCNEFTYEFMKTQQQLPDEDDRKHPYTYYERLTEYDDIKQEERKTDIVYQLEILKLGIEIQMDDQISSNREQAITWYVGKDFNTTSPPCLQRIWIRWYPGNIIDLHLEWRSRDLYNAWQSNIIAITEMMNNEVIKPTGCKLARIIDFSDSLHIYNADIAQAMKIDKMYIFHGV